MNNKNKFLFSSLVVVVVIAAIATPAAFAQQTPPQLEKPSTAATESETSSPAFGKITIQISQTEQIVLDLPIKDGGKYQIVPIK